MRGPPTSKASQSRKPSQGNASKASRSKTTAPQKTPVKEFIPNASIPGLHPKLKAWLETQKLTPLPFQREAWQAYAEGKSGLIVAGTGRGKSYAALLGPLSDLIQQEGRASAPHTLVISPLRALCRDLTRSISRPIESLGLKIKYDERTGDSSAYRKKKMRETLPHLLVTTPESLALMLSYPGSGQLFTSLQTIVVDEWHALLGSKRGVMLELQLAHLRSVAPNLKVWGLSATLAAPDYAMEALIPKGNNHLVAEVTAARLQFEVLHPTDLSRMPRSGHYGLGMVPSVLKALDPGRSTLIFTNTRAQAEAWYGALVASRPEWTEKFALHHGSLSVGNRQAVEKGLIEGSIPFVICTSSLELGIDLPKVDRVMHIGSPKSLGRLRQRAGRAAHHPQGIPSITLVPTFGLQILEQVALMTLESQGKIEPTPEMVAPLDVLCQHMVNRGLGDGFVADDLYQEVTTHCYAYRDLPRDVFDQALRFVHQGGDALQAYPQYKKLSLGKDGRYVVLDTRIMHLQRLNMGTILSDVNLDVKMISGKSLGHVDESFASRLNPGDSFAFAGQALEFVRLHENALIVKKTSKPPREFPIWSGGRLPYSPFLTQEIRATLGAARSPGAAKAKHRDPVNGKLAIELLGYLGPLLEIQKRESRVPGADELLLESVIGRDGTYLFMFPFGGFSLNEAAALIMAMRLSRIHSATFAINANDMGCALLTKPGYDFTPLQQPEFWSQENLASDIDAALGLATLSKRHFHQIARIAGLIYPQYPGQKKTTRVTQASSGLLYDVLHRFEPNHILVTQAHAETRQRILADERLLPFWENLRSLRLCWSEPKIIAPLAAPLWLERFGSHLANEEIAQRLQNMRAW